MKYFKTDCCEATYIKVGRAKVLCVNCRKDVSYEVILLSILFADEYRLKQQQKTGKTANNQTQQS